MRIQHNIPAMNSYRNYSANTKSVSKNLEKLSSGYRINRAGDDAAGLAISEKMRAQITGLKTAQKNAKDGISLVQTAEGALTEVHSMLNRMFELAEQSANGTYDNEVDRANLQKEVGALKTEIDRIADSSNFNGIKLLDGSLGGKADIAGDIALNDTKATASVTTGATFTDAGGDAVANDTFSYTVAWKEGDVEKSATVNFTADISGGAGNFTLVAADGSTYDITDTPTDDEMRAAVQAELAKNSALTNAFDIKKGTGEQLVFTSKVSGTDGAVVTALGATGTNQLAACASGGAIDAANTKVGLDSMQKLDLSKTPVVADGAEATKDTIDAATFEIDGKKFLLAANAATVADLKNVPGDVTIIKLAAASGTTYNPTNDAANVASEISRVTGKTFTAATAAQATASSGDIAANDILYAGDDKLKTSGEDLNLQIGDTADDFNKLAVSVGDMHAAALGISSVDIGSQTGASAAMGKIKNAINSVSSTRGDLGALQNRLDHTINNLSVMTENIQDAESTIRDVDVAEEMMAYTKNNILVQSAQAMLAQANQLPQGVLQLLG